MIICDPNLFYKLSGMTIETEQGKDEEILKLVIEPGIQVLIISSDLYSG